MALAACMMNDATPLVEGLRGSLRAALGAGEAGGAGSWEWLWSWTQKGSPHSRVIIEASHWHASLAPAVRITVVDKVAVRGSGAVRSTSVEAGGIVTIMQNLVACSQPHCYVAKETREAILAGDLDDV